MKKIFVKMSVCVTICILLCSCALKESGMSLSAFTQRLNTYNENYKVTEQGFIADKNNRTFTKFFVLSEKDLMLQFQYNDKCELVSMNIVFDNLTENNTYELTFIKNAVYAYINNDTIATQLLQQTDFDNCIYSTNINTVKAEIGDIELLIDVTEIGTVISVCQNNL